MTMAGSMECRNRPFASCLNHPEVSDLHSIKAEAFLSDEALVAEVDELLRRRRDETENWAYRFWLEDMYLNNPVALPVNSNPGWVFPRQNFRSPDSDLCAYLARLMKGMLDFKQRVER